MNWEVKISYCAIAQSEREISEDGDGDGDERIGKRVVNGMCFLFPQRTASVMFAADYYSANDRRRTAWSRKNFHVGATSTSLKKESEPSGRNTLTSASWSDSKSTGKSLCI